MSSMVPETTYSKSPPPKAGAKVSVARFSPQNQFLWLIQKFEDPQKKYSNEKCSS